MNNRNISQRWPLKLEPFFLIEHCQDCENHSWKMRHQAETYAPCAQELKSEIEKVIPALNPQINKNLSIKDSPIQINKLNRLIMVENECWTSQNTQAMYYPTSHLFQIEKRAIESYKVSHGYSIKNRKQCEHHGPKCYDTNCSKTAYWENIHYDLQVPLDSFEVYFMGIKLYSKLQSKQFPNVKELAQICMKAYQDCQNNIDLYKYEIDKDGNFPDNDWQYPQGQFAQTEKFKILCLGISSTKLDQEKDEKRNKKSNQNYDKALLKDNLSLVMTKRLCRKSQYLPQRRSNLLNDIKLNQKVTQEESVLQPSKLSPRLKQQICEGINLERGEALLKFPRKPMVSPIRQQSLLDLKSSKNLKMGRNFDYVKSFNFGKKSQTSRNVILPDQIKIVGELRFTSSMKTLNLPKFSQTMREIPKLHQRCQSNLIVPRTKIPQKYINNNKSKMMLLKKYQKYAPTQDSLGKFKTPKIADRYKK